LVRDSAALGKRYLNIKPFTQGQNLLSDISFFINPNQKKIL